MTGDEAKAILTLLEPQARVASVPWRDEQDGNVWATGMQFAVQLSIAISLQRIACAQEAA